MRCSDGSSRETPGASILRHCLIRRARLACVDQAFRRFCARHAARERKQTTVVVPFEAWTAYMSGVSRWLGLQRRSLRAVHLTFEVHDCALKSLIVRAAPPSDACHPARHLLKRSQMGGGGFTRSAVSNCMHSCTSRVYAREPPNLLCAAPTVGFCVACVLIKPPQHLVVFPTISSVCCRARASKSRTGGTGGSHASLQASHSFTANPLPQRTRRRQMQPDWS